MAGNRLSQVVWRLSLPLIFVQAAEAIDHLIDSLFLARVGETELGAIAVADAALMLFLALPLGLVDAIQVLTARRVGQRKPGAVGIVFDRGLLLLLGVCAVSTLALKLSWPALSPWFVESDEVGAAVDDYLQIEAYGIVLTAATFAFSALLTSVGRTAVLVPATALLVVTDVLLDYMFVVGGFGCPALGMQGAAIGSIGAEIVTLAFLAIYVGRRLEPQHYRLFRFRLRGRRTTGLLVAMSLPLAGQLLIGDLRWFVFFLIVERAGTQALAVANLVFTCYSVFWIPADAFSETSCSMVSRCVGRDRPHRIGRVLAAAIRGATIATVPFLIASVLVPQWVLAMFAPGAEVLAESCSSLRVVAIAMLIAIPGEMWFGAVVGTGDTKAALGIEGALTLVMLGLAWLAAIHMQWPQVLVWSSVPVASLVCLVLSWAWMKSGAWRRLEV
jgi:putative MATE family efflux protein